VNKTDDDYFADWESHVFGYGYGSAEEHIIPVLKGFLAATPPKGTYDYKLLESACGASPAWLLINTLCHADILEYGTSPRYGWLTGEGRALQKYVGNYSADYLVRQVTGRDENYVPCYPEHCNCDVGPCHNPFWPHKGAGG